LIGLIDLGVGNLFSLSNLFTKITKKKIIIIDNAEFLTQNKNEISHLVLPGVGSYPAAMKMIESSNWKESIIKFKDTNKPILGICLGMQLFFDQSEENEVMTKGLGLLKGNVVKMKVKNSYKLPHVGWNDLKIEKKDPILDDLNLDIDFYFLHSYKCLPTSDDIIICKTDYSEMFPSIIRQNNIIGFQFHPEKSSKIGQKLIENFLNL
jgi:glutamine amidotransferase